MSSIIGHTLNTVGIYANSRQPEMERPSWWWSLLWLGWLGFVGLAPDLNYVIPQLYVTRRSIETDPRITPSLMGAWLFPLLTMAALAVFPLQHQTRRALGMQVTLVGLSHLILDILVGVWPLPLLWPFSAARFKLPFGILPRAPTFQMNNPYLYRNILMELGIFVPVYGGVYLWRRTSGHSKAWAMLLWTCAGSFMA
ncbi:MAG TPA: metal-dependent hydrolase [Anaerolineae bacterium]|nr:metal-dependent hydrolase [Anaerolineae bacterium]HQM13645.1 metal-dependent hydrolase [Anaerolineae bacterium]